MSEFVCRKFVQFGMLIFVDSENEGQESITKICQKFQARKLMDLLNFCMKKN